MEGNAELMTRISIRVIGLLRYIPRVTLIQCLEVEFLFADVTALKERALPGKLGVDEEGPLIPPWILLRLAGD